MPRGSEVLDVYADVLSMPSHKEQDEKRGELPYDGGESCSSDAEIEGKDE